MHRTFDNIIISATHKVVPSNKSFYMINLNLYYL